MSVIDNGRRVRLTVPRLFDGDAGESEGLLAFIPNVTVRPRGARFCKEGELAGRPVRLTFVAEDGPFVTFRYEDAA
jgi:hypothetical protein